MAGAAVSLAARREISRFPHMINLGWEKGCHGLDLVRLFIRGCVFQHRSLAAKSNLCPCHMCEGANQLFLDWNFENHLCVPGFPHA